jgi:hypothetical protein
MLGMGVMDKKVSIWFIKNVDCIPALAAFFIVLWAKKEQFEINV